MDSSPSPIQPRRSPVRWAVRVSAAVVLIVGALNTPGTRAQQPGPQTFENFDIRTTRNAGTQAYRQRFAAPAADAIGAVMQSRSIGLARLESAVNDLQIINGVHGTPEVIGVEAGKGFLTAASTDRPAAMRGFLSTYADAYGVSPADVAGLVLKASYTNPAGNMSWVEFEQRINGLPVFGGGIRGGFTAQGELARTTGQLAPGVSLAGGFATAPAFGAAEAVMRAAATVGRNVPAASLQVTDTYLSGVKFAPGALNGLSGAWPMYFPIAPGVIRLAWMTVIPGDPDSYLIALDAETGTVLFRKNATNYQTQSASYNVYNDDSPAPLSPTNVLPGSGTQASYIARTTIPLIGNEAPNTFNSLGWITDGGNTTVGNNVTAGIDVDGFDGVDFPATGAARVFNFAYDPATDAPTGASYRNGEVTDMFYWANKFHDALYLLGFNEQAGNFQASNFGRGGLGLDQISAEAQDSSGTNNANFTTFSDGFSPGKMQMYVFTGPTPDRVSSLDHDVLLHELAHGLSNRLHTSGAFGGGLQNTFAQGMGEGWSDFYARALLSTAGEDVNAIYSTGGWVTRQFFGTDNNYYYGIRRFPYAVKTNVGGAMSQPHNPLTFADVDSAEKNITNGAYAAQFDNAAFEVHNAGEVWCMALLEVRARFITRLGWAVGNQRILQFVTDGMKLDPANPHFLDGRDAILAAAAAGGGSAADIKDIWAGFATRGMGASATVNNATTGDVTEAFDMPGVVASGHAITTESIPNGHLDATEAVTVSLCIRNTGNAATNTLTGTLLAGGGVSAPSGAQDYGTPAPAAIVCRTFTFTVNGACNTTLTATLQVNESGVGTKNVLFTMLIGGLSTFFNERFDTVVAPALPSGWTTTTISGTANAWITTKTVPSDTLPNTAWAQDLGTISQSALVSTSIAVPAAASRLTFRHRFGFDLDNSGFYDGGVLEISISGGAFTDIITAGGSWVTSGYNGTIAPFDNPLASRDAFVGVSGGYLTTTVNLPAGAQGASVRFRWNVGSDSFLAGSGWYVDTVTVYLTAALCGAGLAPFHDIIQNGSFTGGTTRWTLFSSPDPSNQETDLTSTGAFGFRRVNGPGGQAASQSVIFQETGVPFAQGDPFIATFELTNTQPSRKYMKVLVINSNFDDLVACTFWIPPDGVSRTYSLRGHTTKAWTNAAIYFYASSPKGASGYYYVDNVSLAYAPGQATNRVDCVDPSTPAPGAGSASGQLLTNGNFDTNLLTPWTTDGMVLVRNPMVGGVLEFRRTGTFPPGVTLQAIGAGQPMVQNQMMIVSLQLGNTTLVRRRVLLIAHDNDFSDLVACTWWLEPSTGLANYSMRLWASKAWTNPTVAIYPSSNGVQEWVQADNVVFQRSTTQATVGTECLEPGASFAPESFSESSSSAGLTPTAIAERLVRQEPASESATDLVPADARWTKTDGGWEVSGAAGESVSLLGQEPVDLTGATSGRLTFESWFSGLSGLASAGSRAEVQVSTDGGVNWTSLGTVPATDTWQPMSVALSAFAGKVIEVRFVFHGAATADNWRLRDVNIEKETH